MKSKFFLPLLLLLTSINTFSQNWEKSYGGSLTEEGAVVRQTTDSGFIVAGSTISFGAGSYDFYLIKTDPLGDTLWTKTFGGIFNDKCRSVIQTVDGGYMACGESNSFSSNQNIYLVKTDQSGLLTWSKSIGDSNTQSPSSIVQTSDSGYCIVGTLGDISTGNTRVFLTRTDINGDTLWNKTFGRDILNLGYSLQQTPDNGFIISGGSYNVNTLFYETYIIKTDDLGDTLWTKFISGSGHAYGNSVIAGDSSYVIGGISGENFLALAVDLAGNVLWQYEFDKGGLDRCFSITHTPDNGYLLAGCSIINGLSDMLIIKVDSIGNELWSKKFGGIQYDDGYSIQSLPTGGFVAAGITTNVLPSISQDIFVVRSDCNNFPVVQISVLDTICMGDTIGSTFVSDITSGVTYQWFIYDTIIPGANSSAQFFSADGRYKLTVDSAGCSNTSNEINLSFPPPFFYTNPFEACAGDIVRMSQWNSAVDRYPFYDWDFGDGVTDTGLFTSHVYADTGWYNIIRTVRTSNGNCNSFHDSIQITTTALPPVDFDMLINSTDMLYNTACPGDRIEFIPYAYTYWFVPPPPFDASSYFWDFGDGNTDTSQFPVHYYSQYGMFAVTLTVTNHCGNSSTAIDSILIDSLSFPMASFNWRDGGGIWNDTVITCEQILFSSIGGTSYYWDFDDGNILQTASDTNTHSFTQAGNYNVQMIASNSCGNNNTLTRTIVVMGTCNGIFDPSFQEGEFAFVYPNPFTENAVIRLNNFPGGNSSFFYELIIFDIQGKIVERRKASGTEIILRRNNLTAGIYFFRLLFESGQYVRGKFVVD